MTATLNTNHTLNGYSHISNYKKALMAMFDKKKTWNYLNEQRVAAVKRKEALSAICIPDMDEVIYH